MRAARTAAGEVFKESLSDQEGNHNATLDKFFFLILLSFTPNVLSKIS